MIAVFAVVFELLYTKRTSSRPRRVELRGLVFMVTFVIGIFSGFFFRAILHSNITRWPRRWSIGSVAVVREQRGELPAVGHAARGSTLRATTTRPLR